MDEIISVELFGIRVDEPIVSLTDLIVSFLCFLFFYKLHKSAQGGMTIMYFKYYFLIMGIATTFGGLVGHAFYYELSKSWKLLGWIISMVAIMLIERAAIEHTQMVLKKKYIKILRVVNLVEFAIFLGLTLYTVDFFYVQLHSGYGLMFVVLTIEFLLFLKTKNEASKYIMAGIGFAALSALTFSTQFSIHEWFNYLSLSHIWMAVATVFIYLGVTKISVAKKKKLAVS
ncbi:hypothetical protein JKA74_10995 [Marivirga sp. S37H4]|uniref:Uncharacterized protein n=1 Tax=Marivirga aurantiaca TaxID=2802615 RepID=A0A934WZD7_9BACT|nr:hypothetical protein [Marivirga aurantiaca]MBK6265565.1 hypothetical protein [Marivirga aurantiaca]